MPPNDDWAPAPDPIDSWREFVPPLRFDAGMRTVRRGLDLAGAWRSVDVPASAPLALVDEGGLRLKFGDDSRPLSRGGLHRLARTLGSSCRRLARNGGAIEVPPGGLVLRDHGGVIRSVVSRRYVALDDEMIISVIEREVRARKGRRIGLAAFGTGARTLVRLQSQAYPTAPPCIAQVAHAHDGSAALVVSALVRAPAPRELIWMWLPLARVPHLGEPSEMHRRVDAALQILVAWLRRR